MEKDKKLRPMKIWEILRRETDEDHPMGTETLRERLKESGYPCTRKTLYGDIALLNDNGYEVMRTRKISNEYYVADRSFDIPELRILIRGTGGEFYHRQKDEGANRKDCAACRG